MKKLLVLIIALCLCSCSIKTTKTTKHIDVLRMPQKTGHASIEKLGFKGFQIDVVNSNSGFPKITLGAGESNTVFLPMVTCTETYNVEGIIEKKVCDTIPDVVIDARINPLGNGTVDNLATGNPSMVYHSPEDEGVTQTYSVWIEAIKASLESSVSTTEAEKTTKQEWIKMLSDIANLFKGGVQ